jgi:hypothetical protein
MLIKFVVAYKMNYTCNGYRGEDGRKKEDLSDRRRRTAGG